MKKYDIIYDPENNGKVFKFTAEKAIDLKDILSNFCIEFAKEFGRKPQVVESCLGLKVWQLLTYCGDYNPTHKTINIFDIELVISPDWTVDENYIELTLQ